VIVAVATQKGGSAKTTTVVNLAAALAERGHTTLAVDLDGQGHATHWLLGPAARQNGPFVQDWLEGRADPADVVRSSGWPGLDLVPANLALNRLRDRLEGARRASEARLLASRLRGLSERYAWVLIDCPAGLNGLTVNALAAADRLLVPVAPPDPLAVDGTHHVLVTLERIARDTNSRLSLLGVLVANAQLRRASERRQVEQLRADRLPVFATQIPASARVGAAAEAHETILAYAPNSGPAIAYRALAEEVEKAARRSR